MKVLVLMVWFWLPDGSVGRVDYDWLDSYESCWDRAAWIHNTSDEQSAGCRYMSPEI